MNTGQYSQITNSRPWLSTPVNTNVKSKKSKVVSALIYSIFDQCSRLTDDPFWVSTFEQAAYGKLPRGFFMKDNYLTHKKGSKVQRLEVSNDPHVAFKECKEFFNTTAGIMSQSDSIKSHENYEKEIAEYQSIMTCSWSDIKKKKIKDLLLGSFIDEIAKHLKLESRERLELETSIHILMFLGHIQAKHVTFYQGKIYKIHGLYYDLTNRKPVISSDLKPKTSSSSSCAKYKNSSAKTKTRKNFLSHWNIFLNKLSKTEKKTKGNETAEDVQQNKVVDLLTPISQ